MRVAVGLTALGFAAVMFGGGWAIVLGAVVAFAGGIAVAIVLEERDVAGVEGLDPRGAVDAAATASEPEGPLVATRLSKAA